MLAQFLAGSAWPAHPVNADRHAPMNDNPYLAPRPSTELPRRSVRPTWGWRVSVGVHLIAVSGAIYGGLLLMLDALTRDISLADAMVEGMVGAAIGLIAAAVVALPCVIVLSLFGHGRWQLPLAGFATGVISTLAISFPTIFTYDPMALDKLKLLLPGGVGACGGLVAVWIINRKSIAEPATSVPGDEAPVQSKTPKDSPD